MRDTATDLTSIVDGLNRKGKDGAITVHSPVKVNEVKKSKEAGTFGPEKRVADQVGHVPEDECK